jgi:NADP-dependent 3-hydroxy acid dehydrogenase YdfG
MDFKDKVVLISGATGGMGEEIVKQLSNKGCKLALFARRENKLKKISDKFLNEKTQCIYKKCDVTNYNDVKDAVDFTVKKFGKIDVAILTAGILVPIPIETFDSKIIKESMEVNFLGYVYFIEHLLHVMKKQKSGTIAATSTLPDKRGVPGWGSYGASKAAISWLMESLRSEGKQKYNINFITIKPGSVLTPMIKGFHRKGAITSEKAAIRIINGIKNEKRVIQFPFYQVFPTRFSDLFPPIVYDGQDIEMLKGDGYPTVKEK